jgi:glycosyltransferase involved in cell wall biosynthesis
MKVAIDATPLALSSGGIARYVRELSRALAGEFPDDDFTLISDQPFPAPLAPPANLHRRGSPRNSLTRRWWSWGVQRAMAASGAGLFHGTHFAVPWLPLRPSVMTLHDLSPWLDPRWQAGASFVRRRAPYLLGLGLATRIITHTEAVRREAIDRFHIHPGRISAVPLAAAGHFRPTAAPVRPRPYFLHVGVIEPRKNLATLIAAWREVYLRLGVELLLAGPRRSDGLVPAPEPGLHVLGEVREEELPGLYSGALACLYPSLYEGFGLPVLEAMQCGALVIASRDPAVAEVAGEAAVLVDARDAKAWVEAMRAAVAGAEDLSGRRAKALQRAMSFSWARTARLTHEVYVDALGAFGE